MSAHPDYPDLMPGFRWEDVDADGVRIRAAIGGSGPPLLLLHGHPQTHLTWFFNKFLFYLFFKLFNQTANLIYGLFKIIG